MERKTQEYSRLSYWLWSHSDKNPEALALHFKAIGSGIIYVFLSELLRASTDQSSDEYVTSGAMAIIRRMIWGSEFARGLRLNQKRSLEELKQEELSHFLMELEKVRTNARLIEGFA
jgi:hypothetical protein